MITSKGNILFKVDDSNRAEYETAGSSKHGRMPYYYVPKDVLDDNNKILSWASKAIAIRTK